MVWKQRDLLSYVIYTLQRKLAEAIIFATCVREAISLNLDRHMPTGSFPQSL
jgi:hypothetical protein